MLCNGRAIKNFFYNFCCAKRLCGSNFQNDSNDDINYKNVHMICVSTRVYEIM